MQQQKAQIGCIWDIMIGLFRAIRTVLTMRSLFPVGGVGSDNVFSDTGVRPSFNLESSITYVSGSGSMSDPVRIN